MSATNPESRQRGVDLERLASLLVNVEEATALLPEEEQTRYREAQESVIRARREGERRARELWIG